MKLHTIGGYSEVGKNMTALEIGEDVIILDCGLYLPALVEVEEREKLVMNEKKLRSIGALPEDTILEQMGLRNKVRAILASHAHLDHIGAIPYIAPRYNADVMATPFSTEVLQTLMRDEGTTIPNNIIPVQPNSSCIIRGKKQYKVDFINITHSTLQTALIAVHTDEGVVLYANDFKFDNTPIVGKKPNYEKIREIAKEGVKALVVDSLYSGEERKTPSEKIARGLLEDVLLTTSNEEGCIIVTTFSSHIARLKSIVDFGKQLNRKVVFLGRSLAKYVNVASRLKLADFAEGIPTATYKNQVESMLKKISKNRREYLIVCTGHQGEPGSMLDRLSRNVLPFNFESKDHVIFSSRTIPTPMNMANKQQLEKRLKAKGVRIFTDVHVSGHAAKEDLRDFINMVNPEHIIPAHGDMQKLSCMAELASEMGYKLGKNCHLKQDMQKLVL
ncbi:MAG: RNase J family beta-CASP ribonuclease [archaeon]